MKENSIGHYLFAGIEQEIALQENNSYSDLKVVITPDGKEVGTVDVFVGEKLEKATFVELSISSGMVYTNVSLKPHVEYNIPRFSVNHMVTGDKIQFDVDLYPAVDLVLHQDYIDKYYEPLNELYLKEKAAPYFDWKISDQTWMRASASPFFFKSLTGMENAGHVTRLIRAYLEVWKNIWREETPVSSSGAMQIQTRRKCAIDVLLEREPERKMMEKFFGEALTEKLGRAMV